MKLLMEKNNPSDIKKAIEAIDFDKINREIAKDMQEKGRVYLEQKESEFTALLKKKYKP